MNHQYAVVTDNQVVALFHEHADAQLHAQRASQGRYDTAKVTHLATMTMQGHWFKGERIQ